MVEGIGKILRTMLDKARENDNGVLSLGEGKQDSFIAYRTIGERSKDLMRLNDLKSGVVDSTKFSLGSCHDYNRRTDEDGKEKEYVEE